MLADFLRKSLSLGAKDAIPLADEVALAEGLLAIEKVRFGARLSFEARIDEGARACPVPPLLLQPLVENAVTHGIAHLLEGGSVCLEASRRGDRLWIVVGNPRDPEAKPRNGAGVGLDNVRRRLFAVYSDEARLSVRAEPDAYEVELELPASPPSRPLPPA
jgi:LytS/YehU family sensor histidine kinase